MDPQTEGEPQLLPVAAAAELLNVPPRAILGWIEQERVPYLEMRDDGRHYLLPMHALLTAVQRDDELSGQLGERDRPAACPGARYWSGIAGRGRHLIEACIPGG